MKLTLRHARPLWRLSALALLPLAACSGSNDDDDDCAIECTPLPSETPSAEPQALVISSNYSSGKLSTVALDDLSLDADVQDVSGDTIVKVVDGRVFFLVRDSAGDNYVSERDPLDGFAELTRIATGTGSNPHDVAIVGEKGYVSLWGGTGLAVFDPADGSIGSTIDLTEYADADGKPNPEVMVVAGSTLYVALQRFDLGTFSPASPGKIIEIDTTTDQVTDVIDTTVTNISAIHVEDNGDFLVVGAGAYGVADGGIERIHEGASAGVILSEEDLDGQVLSGFALVSGTGYVLDGDPFGETAPALLELSLTSGEIVGPLEAASSIDVIGLSAYGDQLWLTDSSSALWVLDLGDDALLNPTGIDVTALEGAFIYSLGFLD